MVTILPAILAPTKIEFETDLKKFFGIVDLVQVDIVDGIFAPEKTVTPEDLKEINTAIKFDYHLMVDEPVKWLERCQTPQARGVYGQIERMADPAVFLAKAEVLGFEVGLALDLETPVEKIKDLIWDLDGLVLLAVKAGHQGQKFDERVLGKIEQARALRRDLPLVVDGGLDTEEIKRCIGAEWAEEMVKDELNRNFLDISFVVGSHLLSASNVKEKLESLERLEA
jgi:ribulose-phosphate 3-epimerase